MMKFQCHLNVDNNYTSARMAGKRTTAGGFDANRWLTERSFADVICTGGKGKMDPVVEGNKSVLKDAVFQLISYHQDFDRLLHETSNLKAKEVKLGESEQTCVEAPSDISVNLCQAVLRDQGGIDENSVSFHAADRCAAKLLDLVGPSQTYFLHETLSEEVRSLLNLTKSLMARQDLHRSHFISVLCKQCTLPLHLLWLLHNEDIMALDCYLLTKHSERHFAEGLVKQMVTVCSDPATTVPKETIIAGILHALINLGFGDRKEVETGPVRKIALTILDGTISNLMDDAFSGKEDGMIAVRKAWDSLNVSSDTLKKYCTHTISYLMSYKTVFNVSQAVKQQHSWTYAKNPASVTTFYRQLLLVFEAQEVVDILQTVLERQEVNWQIVLSVISTFLVGLPQAPRVIEDYIGHLLQQGLDNSDMESTITGLLLARQGCHEGPHVFYSYPDWFQRVFGDGNRSPANNKKCFTFFMKFLTDLVPYEKAQHLKFHILRPPYVPPKCRSLLSDYIILAKTRLADLKEPFEAIGVFDDGADNEDKKKQEEQTEEEVLKALSMFSTTGKIPTTIMEASIFRKPYYIGRFLPTLLKARPLPDIPDIRMKFIASLKRSEKIPSSIYSNYESACRNEAAQLLEGVFMVIEDEDSADDMTREPLDQFIYRLDQLTTTVLSPTADVDKLYAKVTELVSMIKEALEQLMCADGTSVSQNVHMLDNDPVIIDPFNASLPHKHVQIIDAVLNTFCRAGHGVLNSEVPNFIWAHQLSVVIQQYTELAVALMVRLWKLTVEQGPSLEEHHVTGMAVAIFYFGEGPQAIGSVKITGNCGLCPSQADKFGNILWQSVPHHTATWMGFSLRLISTYLRLIYYHQQPSEIGNDGHEELKHVSQHLIKKFIFLCTRLMPNLRTMDISTEELVTGKGDQFEIARTLYLSEIIQQCCQLNMLTFEEWVELEMKISPEEDFLSQIEREEYYLWVIYENFLGGVSGSVGQLGIPSMCTTLFQKLLEADIRANYRTNNVPCPRCKLQKIYPNCPNKVSLVNLLQSLVQYLRPEESPEDIRSSQPPVSPWLQQQISDVLSNGVWTDIGRQALVTSFIRLASCLPAHLFFCDSLSADGGISCPNLQPVQEFINNYLRCYANEGCFLPVSLTMYLMQGLLSLSKSLVPNQMTEIDNFLNRCPLLSISLLVHHKKLRKLLHLHQISGSQRLPFLTAISSAQSWADRCVEGKFTPIDTDQSDWLTSAALFSATIQRNDPETVKNIVKCLEQKCVVPSQLLIMFCDMLILQLTAWEISASKHCKLQGHVQNVFVNIIHSQPAIISSIVKEHNEGEITLVTSDIINKLKGVTLLRILQTIQMKTLLQCPGVLSSVVTACGQVFRQFESPSSLQAKDLMPGHECLTMNTVLEMSQFLKLCIEDSPLAALKDLNKASLLECGPDVLQAVERKMTFS